MADVHILNGPNLNLLGTREPEIYGTTTLSDIEKACRGALSAAGFTMVFSQTNGEGDLVGAIQAARAGGRALIINAAAFTHTSIAVRDALAATDIFKIEVHLSNPAARESFRQTNHVAPVVHGSISGFGALGYALAVNAVIDQLTTA